MSISGILKIIPQIIYCLLTGLDVVKNLIIIPKITVMIFKLIAEIIKDASKASNKKLDKNAYADFLNTLSIDDLIVLRDSYKAEKILS